VVVEADDAQRAPRRLAQQFACPGDLRFADPARLVAPRTHRVEPNHEEALGAEDRLDRLPLPLELGPRAREAGRKLVRDVVVPGDDEEGPVQAAQKRRRPLVLAPATAVGEVAGHGDQLGRDTRDKRLEAALDCGFLDAAGVQVGDVEEPHGQRRPRYYTESVPDESTEIFDDLYLGLRAGGALRKQRRGEPLSAADREALGRWARLSSWRKALAIGAFALGTFGLGFTLGGLIFGRWRKA
jgi:hypothetical protein